jgi:hypothetical protein
MDVATEDWSRPAFAPGGGDALLFYLAFGSLEASPLPALPSGFSLGIHPQGEARVWVEPLVAGTRAAGETSAELARVVRGASAFAVLRCQRADPPDLAHLREAESVLAALLDAGAAAVLDVEAQRWWRPEAFRGELLAPMRPVVRAHLSVRTTAGVVETRGLRKFGRPDLRLRGVPPSEEENARDVVWALAERLARGERVRAGESLAGLRIHDAGDPAHPALTAQWPARQVERVGTA